MFAEESIEKMFEAGDSVESVGTAWMALPKSVDGNASSRLKELDAVRVHLDQFELEALV